MDVAIIFFAFICVLLVFVVLLQPGKGDASAIGFGGSSQSIFGSRGAGNFLTKTTAVLATVFFLTSFGITRARVSSQKATDIRSNLPAATPAPVPSPAPVAPAADAKGEAKTEAKKPEAKPEAKAAPEKKADAKAPAAKK